MLGGKKKSNKKQGKEKMEAAASTPCLSCSPCFSRVLAFTPALGYAASDNHCFYITIRPTGPSGIQNTDRHSLMLRCASLTQLARDWQATATFLVPAEMPLGVSRPQTHIQFTLCLITPQYKWTAATRNYPVLTPETISVKFFLPHSDMVWTN